LLLVAYLIDIRLVVDTSCSLISIYLPLSSKLGSFCSCFTSGQSAPAKLQDHKEHIAESNGEQTTGMTDGQQLATFGAGCFWGVENYFRKQFKGQLAFTNVGYMGGSAQNPTYRQVCTGNTGHAEVLHIGFDPSKVKYADLVEFFFRIHDATTLNRQGNDSGTQYRSVVFYHSDEQKQIAEQVKKAVADAKRYGSKDIITEISKADTFWKAEDYHQLYLEANPNGYCNHRIRW